MTTKARSHEGFWPVVLGVFAVSVCHAGKYNPEMRQRFTWNLGKRSLALGERTLVMGVVNVTADSFSDGGFFADRSAAIQHGIRLLSEGADILDVGGESTRPGVAVGAMADISAAEEIRRTIPVIDGVLSAKPDAVISIDTYKPETASAAIAAGACIVNDVSGLSWAPAMAETLARLDCGLVLMHTRGKPTEWRNLPKLEDPVGTVLRDLNATVDHAAGAGIPRDRIVIDPGFGFGKRFDENYPLLARFGDLEKLGLPVLAGPSRKSFIGRTIGRRLSEMAGREAHDISTEQRLYGTLAAITACALQGAHIVRVHDVRATVEALAVIDAILSS
ncbi:MAG TPA: dihydropteroate synthase [Terriglobales bacterium]|nr:dihydropteroate synthase [Terriglobales bacterium]